MTNLDVKDKRETKTNLEVQDEIENILMEQKRIILGIRNLSNEYIRENLLELELGFI